MNSISYLDSILTRSLTSSRSGSGTSTPAVGSTSNSASAALGERNGGTAHLSRRASDYSLSREREHEKRKMAAVLGLTSLDGERSRPERASRRSSRKSSRTGSARHSESEQAPITTAEVRRSRASDGGAPVTPRHPKSHSEGYGYGGGGDDYLQQQQRMRLKRAGSTPAPMRSGPPLSAPSRGWSSLWGFGNFLEANGDSGYDSYARRTSARAERQRHGGGSIDGSGGGGSADGEKTLSPMTRRASMGDAQSALAHFAPDALLSEREREDVVEFEGYDPADDDDLHHSPPHAPPSTPYPGSQTPSGSQTTPTKTHGDGQQQAEGSDRNASTATRLSSLLFGALNPLTDDYFGPQLGAATPANRRRLSEAMTMSERKRRSRRTSQISKDSHSEASSSGHGHSASEQAHKIDEKAASTTIDEKSAESEVAQVDPPPPYSDVSSSSSSSSVLLHPPSLAADGSSVVRTKLGRRKRASSFVVRGVKGTFELLRRLVVMILLSPYRLYQYTRRSRRSHMVEPHAVQSAATANARRRPSISESQMVLQAERHTSAKHQQGQRTAIGEQASKHDGEKQEASEETTAQYDTSDEPITEDQAAERAQRRARRDAMQSSETNGVSPLQQRPRSSSRLLPNPNPVDPLLAHDRTAKAGKEKAEAAEEERKRQMQQSRLRERAANGVAAIAGSALISRGPTSSSLIHHSPKVLVLDLDETLIHSTSRSPTWSALADKSKTRLAVTTGGSLLGFDGLGGVFGLRGQVGVRPHQVEVVLDGRSLIYHVYKRPHVETFLRKVASWYHVVVFTASVQEYADPVIDWLDQGRGLISARLFRESCTFRNGSYYKNLSHIDADLSRICLVDNSPASYMINQANGIPIEGWTHDPNDEALLDLLPVLDSLRFASDVRHILGIRGFSDPALKPSVR